MNWDAIGAVGEIVGAAAVVASLMYLAAQMRQNAREVRSAASDAASKGLVDWLNPLVQNPASFDVFWRGVIGDELDDTETPRFIMLVFTFLKTVEAMHLKHQEGVIDEELWRGWSAILKSFTRHPGIQAYWKRRKPAFTSSFVKWMDEAAEAETASFPNTAELSAALARTVR